MTGNYLRVDRGPLGLWRWWLVDSSDRVVYWNHMGYQSRQGAFDAADRSGYGFLG